MRHVSFLLALALVTTPAICRAGTENAPRVAITSLGSATVEITFSGKINLTGETKHLTYIQPIPALDDWQKVAIDVADHPNLTHEIIEQDANRMVQLVWTDPPAGELDYSIVATVERTSFGTPIKTSKKGTDKAFLKSGSLTKPDKAIKKQAKEITAGATSDLHRALLIALWIEANIEYDLNYSQNKDDKAVTKVMQVMKGTCDELSHLFISMCRAVSIPAREVSGLSYTGNVWGFHSWSEIKLGDQWVQVDATNAQVGFVDALHVSFARDGDDAKFKQGIKSLGTGMFSVLEHDMAVRIIKGSTAKGMIDAKMSFEPATAPPGQPFKAVLTINNPTNSHLAGPARIVVAEGFTLTEPNIIPFVIGPSGTQTITWNIGSPSDLGAGSTYWYKMGAVTFPYNVAPGEFTIAAGIIGEVAAFQDAAGNAVVAVGLKNPLAEDQRATCNICMYDNWELEGDPKCYNDEALVAPGETKKMEFTTEFVISGDFAIEVEASMGELDDVYIQKVKTGGGQ